MKERRENSGGKKARNPARKTWFRERTPWRSKSLGEKHRRAIAARPEAAGKWGHDHGRIPLAVIIHANSEKYAAGRRRACKYTLGRAGHPSGGLSPPTPAAGKTTDEHRRPGKNDAENGRDKIAFSGCEVLVGFQWRLTTGR